MKNPIPIYALLLLILSSLSNANSEAFDVGKARLGVEINAFPASIPDGDGIVFKKGELIGVAILKKQTMSPEKLSYEWYILNENDLIGKTPLNEGSKGNVVNVDSIHFGPFKADWSCNRDGRGFVYLDNELFIGIIIDPDLEKLGISIIGTPLIRALNGDEIFIFPKVQTKG